MFVIAVLAGIAQVSSVSSERPLELRPKFSESIGAGDAFTQLARLVGIWRPANRPGSPLRIRFYLTAGGTVIVESWEMRGKPHSLTLYHRDGKALLATHYCPQGNQPRLVVAGSDSTGLHFTFLDATDLEPATESHQHDLWFDLKNPERPVRAEVYYSSKGPGAREQLELVRDYEGPAGKGTHEAD